MNERGYPTPRPVAEPVQRIVDVAKNDSKFQEQLTRRRISQMQPPPKKAAGGKKLNGLLISGVLLAATTFAIKRYDEYKGVSTDQSGTGEVESKQVKHEKWSWSESGMSAGAKLTEVDGVRVLTVMLDTSPPKILKGLTRVPHEMGEVAHIRVSDILERESLVGHNIVITYENGSTTRVRIDPRGGFDRMLNSWSY